MTSAAAGGYHPHHLSIRTESPYENAKGNVITEMWKLADSPQLITDNTIIFVTMEGFFEGKMFLERVTLPLGTYFREWGFKGFKGVPLPKGLAHGVLTLVREKGSRGRVILKEKATYDEDTEWSLEEGNVKVTVPAGQTVVFILNIWEVDEVLQVSTLAFPTVPTAPIRTTTSRSRHLRATVINPLINGLDDLSKICEKLVVDGVNFAILKSYESSALKFYLVKEYLLVSEFKHHMNEIPEMLDYTTDLLIYFACMGMDKILAKLRHSDKDRLKNLEDAIRLSKVQSNHRLMSTLLFERALLRFQAKQYEDALTDFEEVSKHLDDHFKMQDYLDEQERVLTHSDKARILNEFKSGIGFHMIYVIRKFCTWYYCSRGCGIEDLSPGGKCVMKRWEADLKRILEQSRILIKETKVKVLREKCKKEAKKQASQE